MCVVVVKSVHREFALGFYVLFDAILICSWMFLFDQLERYCSRILLEFTFFLGQRRNISFYSLATCNVLNFKFIPNMEQKYKNACKTRLSSSFQRTSKIVNLQKEKQDSLSATESLFCQFSFFSLYQCCSLSI